MATTVFNATFTGSDVGWAGYEMVSVVNTSELSAASGTLGRLTLKFTALSAGTTVLTIYFGQQGPGDAFDFNGTQAQVFFGGLASITGDGSTLTYVSDWCTLGAAYDSSKNYVLALKFGAGTVSVAMKSGSGGVYYSLTANNAATTDKTGLTTQSTTSLFLLKTIEIDAVASGVTYPQLERGIRGLNRGLCGGMH